MLHISLLFLKVMQLTIIL